MMFPYFITQIGFHKYDHSFAMVDWKDIGGGCQYGGFSSIYKPTNAHIISHKTLLKHFKTL